MSRTKILKNIKKNTANRVQKEHFEYKKLSFEDKKAAFIDALKRAGGEIVDTTEGFDVVLEAEFGVCENAACFINSQKERKNYSFYESIAIVLNEENLFDTMHEAMQRVAIDDFGIFLSGPSKTADIEQSLVIGAHGAKRVGIFLIQTPSL